MPVGRRAQIWRESNSAKWHRAQQAQSRQTSFFRQTVDNDNDYGVIGQMRDISTLRRYRCRNGMEKRG